jgi:predicted O-linked N-acetylglucosamine transferase (SPINDLY family)
LQTCSACRKIWLVREETVARDELPRITALARQNRLEEALAALDQIDADDDPVVLNLTGAVLAQLGQAERAEICLRRALSIRPGSPVGLSNLAAVLVQRGAFAEAEALSRDALAAKPAVFDTWLNLGRSLAGQQRFAEAAASFRSALGIRPDAAAVYGLLAEALINAGDLKGANDACETAIGRGLNDAHCWNQLGRLWVRAGDRRAAGDAFRAALNIDPDYAAAHCNLGAIAFEDGAYSDALMHVRRALELQPEMAAGHVNFAKCMLRFGNLAEAQASAMRAVGLSPESPDALDTLGSVHHAHGRFEQAIACYRSCLELQPDHSVAGVNLGRTLVDAGLPSEALDAYRSAHCRRPDDPMVLAGLRAAAQEVCAFEELAWVDPLLEASTAAALQRGQRPSETPFRHLSRCQDPNANLAVARAWSLDALGVAALGSSPALASVPRHRTGRIRLGYLSYDFRRHVIGYHIAGLLEEHDRTRFSVTCYSLSSDDGSECRKQIVAMAERFVELHGLHASHAAAKIKDDAIDILIDLTGYTRGGRVEICALRPAPLQVSYLGFPASTGAPFMDYLIADHLVVGPEADAAYAEQLVFLANFFQPFNHRRFKISATPERASCGLPDEAFVFCSFSQSYKIDQRTFAIWMRILRQVNGSVLWLLGADARLIANLQNAAAHAGIGVERLIFADWVPYQDHLARLRLADLALDTMVYSGGSTVGDAVWLGIPTICFRGSSFCSRMGSAVLTVAGVEQLIADTPENYAELAVQMARTPAERQRIRARLDMQRSTGPLFDLPAVTRQIEQAYARMWQRFLKADAPASFSVASAPG